MPTPQRHIRVDDDLWRAMRAAAKERGETVADATRWFFYDYVEGNLPGYTSGFVAGVAEGKAIVWRGQLIDAGMHVPTDVEGVESP